VFFSQKECTCHFLCVAYSITNGTLIMGAFGSLAIGILALLSKDQKLVQVEKSLLLKAS
jgi:hypothetical protein